MGRLGRYVAIGAALAGVALAAWLRAPDDASPTQPGPSPPAPAAALRLSVAVPAASVPATAEATSHAGAWRDALAGQPDLKRAFERLAGSADASERAAAWRAWSACIPAFLGSSAQAASPEQLGAAFAPGPEREQRREALRELYARCQGFLQAPHDALADEARRIGGLHASGQLRSRAETARERLAMGDSAGALQSIGEAIASRDPNEIRELGGLVELLHADGAGAAPTDRLRDAALAVVACDLGLDCSPGSTLALQLCAMHGRCSGDVAERTLAALPEPDRAALDAERRRLATLLRAGRFDVREYFGAP